MGILAFIQSLLFLVIWLWICVVAGAAPAPKNGSNYDLRQSHYDPVKQRDPFGETGVGATKEAKIAPAVSYAFRLEGILYQPKDPSAIINGTLVTANKIVTLNGGSGDVQVKAVEITRRHVVLEVGGKQVELQMNSPGAPASQP